MTTLKYLSAYPAHIQDQVRTLIEQDRLAETLRVRYPERHDVRSDSALYDYVLELKNRHLRTAPPVAKVAYDSALGWWRRRSARRPRFRACRVQSSRASGKSASPRCSATARRNS
jgi:predicted metal-dependent hydrolase